MDLVGRRFGHIALTAHLGHGGMGDVYVGFDETLQRRVAVKVIRAGDRLNATMRARLVREARTLSQLDHPNICRIYDYIQGDDVDVLVLELIEGRTLRQAIAAGTSRAERLRIAIDVAEALVAAHRAGIIHRDLKPENAMLSSRGEVKVLDFGLARSMRSAAIRLAAQEVEPIGSLDSETTVQRGDQPVGGATAIGAAVGTPGYMSPEQARGEAVTAASDMYSFGLLLQFLFTGKPAHDPTSSAADLLQRAARGESSEIAGVSRDIAALVNRLKQPAPTDRPTARETLARLHRIVSRPKRIAQRVAAVVTLLLIGAATAKYTLDLRIARGEAEQRRNEAEDLIGFMLGDLRKKLQPVGRLDVLDDVSAKVLRYVGSVGPNASAPELTRTAMALDQIGEVRIAQGKLSDALLAFERSRIFAEAASKSAPNDGEAQLAYATSRFWVGNALRLRGDLQGALTNMVAYRDVASRLAARFRGNDKYQLESAYGYSNVGTILEAQGNLPGALENYDATKQIEAARAASKPSDGERQSDLAVTLNKIGVVQLHLGQLTNAQQTLQSEFTILQSLVAQHPENMTWKRHLATSYSYRAQLQELFGNIDGALALQQMQLQLGTELSNRDPTNAQQLRELAVAHGKGARLLRLRGSLDKSLREADVAAAILRSLVAKEPQRKEWRRDMAQVEINRARTLLARHRIDDVKKALAHSEEELQHAGNDTASRRLAIEMLITKGDVAQTVHDSSAATAAWSQAAAALTRMTADDRDPMTLALYAGTLLRLGRAAGAGATLQQLDRIGYRSAELTSLWK